MTGDYIASNGWTDQNGWTWYPYPQPTWPTQPPPVCHCCGLYYCTCRCRCNVPPFQPVWTSSTITVGTTLPHTQPSAA